MRNWIGKSIGARLQRKIIGFKVAVGVREQLISQGPEFRVSCLLSLQNCRMCFPRFENHIPDDFRLTATRTIPET